MITLRRPVPDHKPTHVSASRVWPVGWEDVPTSLREHAWTLLGNGHAVHGPGEHWWTMGVFYRPGGVALTLVARIMRDQRMQYGHVQEWV